MLFLYRFSRRDPFAATDDVTGKLVVALYAWDGNSFPGNEYWVGQTGSSGDSAAASCSQVENSKKIRASPGLLLDLFFPFLGALLDYN